jgi:AAHS family 4-hydroxybenzoate transporter-like MFS transporter
MNATPRTVDVARLLDERKLSSFNWVLIAVSLIITVFDGFDAMMISFAAPYMHDEFGFTKTEQGYIFGAGTLGMVIGGLALTYIGDRVGRRWTVVGCAFAFGMLTLATAFANSFGALVALRLLDGIALGGMLPLAWALNIEFAPKHVRATVVAMVMFGYSLGSAFAGPLTNFIAPPAAKGGLGYGWEGVYIAGGIGTLVCAVALLLTLPESIRFLVIKRRKPALIASTLRKLEPSIDVTPQDNFVLSDEPEKKASFPLSALFVGKLLWITPILAVAYFASAFAIYFGSSWGPTVLEALQFSRQTAATVSSIGGLLGATTGILLMRINDRHGLLFVAIVPAIAVPVLLSLGFGMIPTTLFLVFVVFQAMLIGGEHASIISISGTYYPSSMRAFGAGVVSSIGKIGGAVAPVVGGLLLSKDMPAIRSYAVIAIFPAILCLCLIGIALVLRGPVHTEPEADVVPAS